MTKMNRNTMNVTTWRIGVVMLLATAIIAPDAYAYRSTFTVDKCLAGKIKTLGKDAAAQTGCQSKAAAKGDPLAGECVTKASGKLTSAFGKLDVKYPSCPGGTGNGSAFAARTLAYTDSVAATVGFTPGGSKCDAAKNKCVGKYVAGITGCYAKAAGKGGVVDNAPGGCTAKTAAKLVDGLKGCLDKGAAAGDCATAGSQGATLKTAADAFLDTQACLLDPAGPLARPEDPVVLTGAEIAGLNGIAPGDLVAFRYDGGWEQVPVQVDERAVISFDDVYDHAGGSPFCGGNCGGGFTRLDYTDAGTFTGPDPDATVDADDEVVFMAADVGTARAGSASAPAGVVGGTGVELAIVDPLSCETGYVYLFQQTGALDPSAGEQYVTYDFDLLSGPYLTTYNLTTNPNPEDTTVTTDVYARRFIDRWVQDELRIFKGGATGVDILDRHKTQFFPDYCVRTEDSFTGRDGSTNIEGAFVANRAGPVRAIRSYVGANSGPRAQRQHIYYRGREDETSFLRVHAIPSIMVFHDYSAAAFGMTYANDNNPSGVTIDGTPDAVAAGPLDWELVTGPQGSLVVA
ncbi:MAG: hypothetical protein IT293_10410, partial [Deltaproteobacteria bacterium]|nr:hypothetical protein [Deltaproteobacteria bacterium]